MAFDPISGRVVMYGGCTSVACDAAGQSSETWLLDVFNNTWISPSPPSNPGKRAAGAMTYYGNGRVLLHGGISSSSHVNETWSYDVANNQWSNLLPAGNTGTRAEHSIAFNVATNKIILFGGTGSGIPYTQDTFAYNVASNTWVDTGPPGTKPVPRRGHGMAYLPGLKRTYLFGGSDSSGVRNDLWRYDDANTTWSSVAAVGVPNPAAVPIVSDPSSDSLIVFGGCPVIGCMPFNDATWVYNQWSNSWTDKTPWPGKRQAHAFAYQPRLKKAALFGGSDGVSDKSDTWVFDVTSDRWSRIHSPLAPSPRRQVRMTYDSSIDRMVLFGGYTGSADRETWLLDLQNETWSRPNPASPPPARFGHSLTYDPIARRSVLFGGYDGGSVLPETWLYDGLNNTWSNPAPSSPPGPRSDHLAAYDPPTGRIVVFGGWNGNCCLGDTWTYSVALNQWDNTSPGGSPSSRSLLEGTFDQVSQRVLLFGGWDPGFLNDTWLYGATGNRWINIPGLQAPSPRSWHSVGYDEENARVLLYGGFAPGGQTSGDMWVFTGTPPVKPQVVSSSPTNGAAGVPAKTNVTVDFNVAMDPGPTSSSFSISPPVPGTASVTGSRLAWTHPSPFAVNSSYTVTISTNAVSAAGDRLPSPYQFSFSTGPPPRVLSTNPLNGTTGVPVTSGIIVTFSQPMEPLATGGAFSISPSVPGNISVIGQNLTFAHSIPFSGATIYTASISTAAKNTG
ncbi:MAG TPA: kelch repeat-containing protein, partial [Thermoplasmata archaeon]|nr:kelch repeat-containing protein [Thermoplasmata archaeon]